MSLLAYDPDRLVRLSNCLQLAHVELGSVRNDDPAAADAMRAIRVTIDALEVTWLPLVRSVMSSDVLRAAGRGRTVLEQLDDSLAWVMSNGYGWSVASDPLRDDAVITVEEARALAVRMQTVSADAAADDPAVLSWITGQLRAIAADPRLSREFLANFKGWAQWGDALARSRAKLGAGYPNVRVDVGALDDVFEGLGHIQRSAGTDTLTWIDDVMPYTAAAIVRYLALDAAKLASVTDHLLGRLTLGATAPVIPMDGPDVGDLLFPVLLRDPQACERYMHLAAMNPEAMFSGASDRALAYRVAIVGTDPSQMSIADAGAVVPAVVQYFADTNPPGEWGGFLADVITPWTFQFAPAVDDWAYGRDRLSRLFDFVLSNDAALNRIIENSEAVLAGAHRSLGTDRALRLAEFSTYVGMIGVITVNERVKGVARRRRAWDLLCGVASIGASLIPGVVLGAAATVAVMAVQANAGPDLDRARKNSLYSKDLATTIAGAVVLHAVAAQLKCEGLLPAEYPPTPQANPHPTNPKDLPTAQFWDDFKVWMSHIPGGWDGPAATRVLVNLWAVSNPHTMGADVGEQVSGMIGP